MSSKHIRTVSGLFLVVLLAAWVGRRVQSPSEVERGRYLVEVGGCNDCHTPKMMTAEGPMPDTTRLLMGHPSTQAQAEGATLAPGWMVATNGDLTAWSGPWGVSFAANLTPDGTGIGSWTPETFMQTIRAGKHAGVGRPLLPPMPWFNYRHMTDEDLRAVYAYLRSLPAIRNQVPAPLPPPAAAHPPTPEPPVG